MPSGGLLALKNRIKSVKSTQKTTKAMSMIAAAKMRKAKVKLEKNNVYLTNLEEMGHAVFKYAESPENNILIKENSSDKKLVFLLGSDTGLCGGFNGNGPNYLRNEYGKSDIIDVALIGKRCRYYLNKYGYDIVREYPDFKDVMTIKEARIIGNELINLFLKEEYGQISVVYTHYESATRQKVVEEQILPFKYKEKYNTKADTLDYDVEANSDELVSEYIMRYIEEKLINAVHHSKTSEHNARMIAMDNATKNAKEMADDLNVKYNQLRQGAITQEIAEIVGGAESIKKKRR
ncbi:ATP synthase F1 subunit gamma [Clostridium massiliamazoniense]|uniref:ATP synthase F1 subunit gamma n=1 Tax=Clostridium massiliamazoniense TaxID=1347366 RepID=UPI0006D80689|nr:ATP synthase F1 subunit gamma [Clostridium massiliamazoniense]